MSSIMSSLELPSLQTILVLVFAFVFVALAGLSGLVRYWQVEVSEKLRLARQYLRSQELKQQKLQIYIDEHYASGDPEPFGSRVSVLLQLVESYNVQVKVFRTRYIRVQEAINLAAPKELNRLPAAPVDWNRIRKQMEDVQDLEDIVMDAWTKIDEKIQELEEVAWITTVMLREGFDRSQEVDGILDKLAEKYAHGEAFSAALRDQETLRSAMERVPTLFFSGTKEEILDAGVKDNVIELYQLLDEHLPHLDSRAVQAASWKEHLNNAASSVKEFQQASQDLVVLLSSAPKKLVVQPVEQRLERLVKSSAELSARLAAPHVEELQTCASEAHLARQMIEELRHAYDTSLGEMQELPQVVAEVMTGIRLLQERFTRIEISPLYAFVWDLSKPRFSELQQQMASITTHEGPKSPAQLKRDLGTAKQQLAQLGELIDATRQVEEQYPTLVAVLGKLNRQEILEWCNDTRTLSGEVKVHNIDNWPRKGDLDYEADLKVIEDKLLDDYPPLPAAPIKESEFVTMLQEAVRFSGLYEVLQDQVSQVRKRLYFLQDLELESQEKLKHALMYINELGLMAVNNPALEAVFKDKAPAFQREVEEMVVRLDNRQKGIVEEKSAQVQDLLNRIDDAVVQWLQAFESKLSASRQRVSGVLDILKEISVLDEPLILEAQEILSEEPSSSGKGLNLSAAVETFKKRNQEWYRLQDVISNLGEIQRPVTEAHRDLEEKRREALSGLDQAEKLIPESSWAPNSVALRRISQEFSTIERELAHSMKQPRLVDALVSTLNDFSGRCQAIREKTGERIKQAESENNEIDLMVKKLSDLIILWEALPRRFPGDALVQEEVDDLVNDLLKSRNKLEKRQLRDPIAHQRYVRELSGLIKRANDAAVLTEHDYSIDIQGNVVT
jgi:hypothetical protein